MKGDGDLCWPAHIWAWSCGCCYGATHATSPLVGVASVKSWHSSFGLWKRRRIRVWHLQGKAQWHGSEACMIDCCTFPAPPTTTRELLMNVWCLTTHMGVCHLGTMKRLMSRKWSEKQIGLEKVSNMRSSDAFVCIHHRYGFSICNDDRFTVTLKCVDTILVSHILSFYSQTLRCISLVLHVIDRQKVQYNWKVKGKWCFTNKNLEGSCF